ncbi:unnamed protein product, partial [Polarella glacialis]
AGRWQGAVGLLSQMLEMKVTPDDISYGVVVTACQKGSDGRQWARALEFFAAMQRQSLQPNVIAYEAALSACEQSQNWSLALRPWNVKYHNPVLLASSSRIFMQPSN